MASTRKLLPTNRMKGTKGITIKSNTDGNDNKDLDLDLDLDISAISRPAASSSSTGKSPTRKRTVAPQPQHNNNKNNTINKSSSSAAAAVIVLLDDDEEDQKLLTKKKGLRLQPKAVVRSTLASTVEDNTTVFTVSSGESIFKPPNSLLLSPFRAFTNNVPKSKAQEPEPEEDFDFDFDISRKRAAMNVASRTKTTPVKSHVNKKLTTEEIEQFDDDVDYDFGSISRNKSRKKNDGCNSSSSRLDKCESVIEIKDSEDGEMEFGFDRTASVHDYAVHWICFGYKKYRNGKVRLEKDGLVLITRDGKEMMVMFDDVVHMKAGPGYNIGFKLNKDLDEMRSQDKDVIASTCVLVGVDINFLSAFKNCDRYVEYKDQAEEPDIDFLFDKRTTRPAKVEYKSVTLTEAERKCLDETSMLNDSVIEYRTIWLREHVLEPSRQNRCYFFSSFFFPKLNSAEVTDIEGQKFLESFTDVAKWTKKINIFERDFLFFPLHLESRYHWALIIVCNAMERYKPTSRKDPTLIYLDSMNFHSISATTMYEKIECYLDMEWRKHEQQNHSRNIEFTNEWQRLDPTVPQQRNGYDCGMYVLEYMEKFIEEVVNSEDMVSARLEDLKEKMEKWSFDDKHIAQKRIELDNNIGKLFDDAFRERHT